MQFSVVTWRRPLDEEVVAAEGLVGDLAPVSNESLMDTGNSTAILHFKVTDVLRLFNSVA